MRVPIEINACQLLLLAVEDVKMNPQMKPQELRNRGLLAAGLLLTLAGCAGTPVLEPTDPRPFNFKRDSLAYANETVWEYRTDPATGRISTQVKAQEPEFTKRCFTLSHMTRQFFQHARFDPTRPKADALSYREAIDAVVARSADDTRTHGKVVIPGYANLRRFSRDHERLLKAASGGPWSSYLQLSNWRMIFPFSRDHQAQTAQQLLEMLKRKRLPLVHLIRFDPFPLTEIDHFVLLISAVETAQQIVFRIYEPNDARRPGRLFFDRATRSFVFPRNGYFVGGPIDVYEVNRSEYY